MGEHLPSSTWTLRCLMCNYYESLLCPPLPQPYHSPAVLCFLRLMTWVPLSSWFPVAYCLCGCCRQSGIQLDAFSGVPTCSKGSIIFLEALTISEANPVLDPPWSICQPSLWPWALSKLGSRSNQCAPWIPMMQWCFSRGPLEAFTLSGRTVDQVNTP
jgi:hypothetical protein